MHLFTRELFRFLFFIISLAIFFDSYSQDIIWQAEAETGIISGTTEIVTSCSNASGGEFVKLNADPGNSLVLENIEVPYSGLYRLKIDYFYLGERPLEILANEVSAGVFYLPEATWCFQGPPAEYALDIYLYAGQNTLTFKPNNNANAPFIDKLTLTEIFKPGTTLRTSANRILQGQYTEVFVELEDVTIKIDTVYLEIEEDATGNSVTRDTTIIFLPGNREICFLITNPENILDENVKVKIAIDSVSSGLSIGKPDSLMLSFVNKASAFYISSSEGNDQYEGTDINSPWKSLERASDFSYVPGDSVLFKSGNTFNGQLRIQRSGAPNAPLYFGAYGNGSKPIIDGANATGGAWTSAILVNNASHIILEGLEVTNDRRISRPGCDDQIGYGINIFNDGENVMENFLLKNLTVRDVYAITINGVEFNNVKVAGIQMHTEINTLEDRVRHIRDVVIEDCYITHTGKYGIWSRHEGAWQDIGNDTLNRNMNIVIRNNHFFETGGAGITLARTHNALLENNLIEKSGSGIDPRMVNRGSGAWFWKCNNILAQYNNILHSRGPLDSYGIHVDWGNRDVFIQYNYSEDIEGGFVEILGDNINSVYRFNISVNDGFRDYRGNSIWISRFAGRNDEGVTNIPSDSTYIYNNTIYVEDTLTPGVEMKGKNTFIYNNIFYAAGNSTIGDPLDIWAYDDAEIKISNNLYYGEVNSLFTGFDDNPLYGDPILANPGLRDTSGYTLESGSLAFDTAVSFNEPVFQMAGRGIFSHVSGIADKDLFGNPVNILYEKFNVGAYNGKLTDSTQVGISKLTLEKEILVYPNPATNRLNISFNSIKNQNVTIKLISMGGVELYINNLDVITGDNNLLVELPPNFRTGLILLILETEEKRHLSRILKY